MGFFVRLSTSNHACSAANDEDNVIDGELKAKTPQVNISPNNLGRKNQHSQARPLSLFHIGPSLAEKTVSDRRFGRNASRMVKTMPAAFKLLPDISRSIGIQPQGEAKSDCLD